MRGENQKTILLVEDEVLVAMSEKRSLEKYGYKVIVAKTGEEAISTLHQLPNIDLILMDINLGDGMDGTEAAQAILRDREIPIVFLSSHIEREVVQKTESITSYGYIVKNTGETILIASIKMAFKLYEANRALMESEERYRVLFEAESDAVFLIDNETGCILEANGAAAALYEYSHEELLNKRNVDLSAEPEETQRITHGTPVISDRIVTIPLRYHRKKNGSVFPVEITGRFFESNGRPVHIAAIRDITERKRAEKEINRQLSEKEALLREVHHRIKNNIASIEGLLSLHMEATTNAEAQSVLQETLGWVNSIRVLYNHLLISDNYNDILVKGYTENLIDMIVMLFSGNEKIIINKRIDDFTLSSGSLFPLGIIINELLTNALKYAFKGRDSGEIDVSLNCSNGEVKLIIQDNGIGLPDGFDIKSSQGFGLMLVSMLSEQIKGTFKIESNNGTRYVIEFICS